MFWRLKRATSSITYAIILFFVFDGLALGLNVWLTERIQTHTVELNLAGRQRMLSQKIVKEFLSSPPGATTQAKLTQLAQTTTLFDRTLSAFRIGGSTVNTDNSLVSLHDFNNRSYAPIIEETWAIWSPLREHIYQYTKSPTPERFVQLNQELNQHNLTLLNNMNNLAFAIETQARSETHQVRLFQALALVLAILNFVAASVLYRRKVKTLEKERTLIDTLLNDMPSAMVFTDNEGYILNENPRFISLLGISLEEAKRYRIQDLITPEEGSSDHWKLTDLAFNRARLKVERTCAIEDDQELTIWRIEDVSKAYQQQEQLSALAFKDPLTELYNRAAFEQHLRDVRPTLSQAYLNALMFIDLDGFKQVNDLFGHSKGDEVLSEVGDRLRKFCDEHSYIARRGGDEFTVLTTQLTSKEQAEKMAESIIEDLSMPYSSLETPLDVSASIGLVVFRGAHSNIINLISKADNAMYLAKQKDDACRIHVIEIPAEPPIS